MYCTGSTNAIALVSVYGYEYNMKRLIS